MDVKLDHVVGGASEVESDQVEEISQKLQQNLHQLKDENLKLLKVDKVTKQVVAGMLYRITGTFVDNRGDKYSCEVTIWERAWMDGPEKLIVELINKETLTKPPKCKAPTSPGKSSNEL